MENSLPSLPLVVAFGAVLSLFVLPSMADDNNTTTFSGEQIPTKKEIIEAFKTRGLSPGTTLDEKDPVVSFEQINFEFNSAELTPRATSLLATIGEVLTEDHNGRKFEIQGHTDATGSAEYNMGLSKRRAEAVKRFLISHYKIDTHLLKTVGRGKTDLLDKDNPGSEANRRVVFAVSK